MIHLDMIPCCHIAHAHDGWEGEVRPGQPVLQSRCGDLAGPGEWNDRHAVPLHGADGNPRDRRGNEASFSDHHHLPGEGNGMLPGHRDRDISRVEQAENGQGLIDPVPPPSQDHHPFRPQLPRCLHSDLHVQQVS